MKEKLNVVIADDHTLFRKAMVNLVNSFSHIDEVREAANGKELLGLLKERIPHVAIVDLQMPIMDGVETCEHILSKYPEVKIIVLTMHDSEKYIMHMTELGVHAFLLKNAEPEELEKAIYAVHEKDFYHNELVASVMRKSIRDRVTAVRPDFHRPELSDREKEVLVFICQELTIREIASRMGLSENTVRNHRANIMHKIGVANVVGMVRYAYDTGLIQ